MEDSVEEMETVINELHVIENRIKITRQGLEAKIRNHHATMVLDDMEAEG